MKVRIFAAMVLIPLLFIVFLFVPTVVTACVVGLMCVGAAYELLHNTGFIANKRVNVYAMLSAFAVSVWCYLGSPAIYGLLGIMVLYALLFSEVMFTKLKVRSQEVLLCAFAALMMPYMLSALLRIVMLEQGRVYIFIPFLVAFLSDTGGYFAGMLFGKHKLCPTVSPKKTVEGFVGGIFASVAGMVVFKLLTGPLVSMGFAVFMGIIGALGSVFGDLSMSAIKRQAGIKDYGRLIPGHGGILDRFDSVLITAPLTELLLVLFVLV